MDAQQAESWNLSHLVAEAEGMVTLERADELPAWLRTTDSLAAAKSAAARDNWFLRSSTEYARDKASGERVRAVWRWVSVLSLLLNCVLGASIAYLAVHRKAVLHILQIDEHGYAVPIPSPPRSTFDHPALQNVIMRDLSVWLRDWRTVVTDPAGQRELMNGVYAMTPKDTVAHDKLEAWYVKHDPFESKGRTVETHVQFVKPISERVWRVEWTERERFGAQEAKTAHFSGLVTVEFSPTTMFEDVTINALGTYVVNFTYDQKQAAR